MIVDRVRHVFCTTLPGKGSLPPPSRVRFPHPTHTCPTLLFLVTTEGGRVPWTWDRETHQVPGVGNSGGPVLRRRCTFHQTTAGVRFGDLDILFHGLPSREDDRRGVVRPSPRIVRRLPLRLRGSTPSSVTAGPSRYKTLTLTGARSWKPVLVKESGGRTEKARSRGRSGTGPDSPFLPISGVRKVDQTPQTGAWVGQRPDSGHRNRPTPSEVGGRGGSESQSLAPSVGSGWSVSFVALAGTTRLESEGDVGRGGRRTGL